MRKSELRTIETWDANEICYERENYSICGSMKFVEYEQYIQRIDEIEDKVNEVISILKEKLDYEKGIKMLEELSNGLY